MTEETESLKRIRETAQRAKTLLENLEEHLTRIFPTMDSTETNAQKQAYKVRKVIFTDSTLRHWYRLKERRLSERTSIDSLNQNYALMAEYIAYTHRLDDDEPIEFYEQDKVFTNKQFEKKNYICTILPHERAKILNFTEEEKKEQNKVRFAWAAPEKLRFEYPLSISSRYDYSKDPCEGWSTEGCDFIKKEYAYRHSQVVPPYEILYAIIIKHNLSSNMLWKSEIKFGKSKAACIYHIASHFSDFSIFAVAETYSNPRDYPKGMESWFNIHGIDIVL